MINISELIPDTINRLDECGYFIMQSMKYYHAPKIFYFNLNASFQALKNLDHAILGNETNNDIGKIIKDKYKGKKHENDLIVKFHKIRDRIVHQNSLIQHSKIQGGIFRYNKFKFGILDEIIGLQIDSFTFLEGIKKHFYFFLDDERSSIGEQFGVKRVWICKDLNDEEIVKNFINILKWYVSIFQELDCNFTFELEYIKVLKEHYQYLLETDIDGNLAKKWGWT